MAKEIERKFLVDLDKWKALDKPQPKKLRQAYILTSKEKSIRVRITDSNAHINIKGETKSATRSEFEYDIPIQDAEEIIEQFAVAELSKYRYEIIFAGKLWEVDEFMGKNQGLIVAEIELDSEDENFEKPDWVTEEVTLDARYYNANLVLKPFGEW